MDTIHPEETIYGLSDQEMVLQAYEAVAGPVYKYVGGLYKENTALTWTDHKSALIRQYASERTAIEAVRKLFRLRQGDREAVEDLGKRIAGLAALVFPQVATWNSGPIQALLADVCMDVLSDRELWGNVLREGSRTLAAHNSERLWVRTRGSMARDTKIMKKKDQVRVWDPKEEWWQLSQINKESRGI